MFHKHRQAVDSGRHRRLRGIHDKRRHNKPLLYGHGQQQQFQYKADSSQGLDRRGGKGIVHQNQRRGRRRVAARRASPLDGRRPAGAFSVFRYGGRQHQPHHQSCPKSKNSRHCLFVLHRRESISRAIWTNTFVYTSLYPRKYREASPARAYE